VSVSAVRRSAHRPGAVHADKVRVAENARRFDQSVTKFEVGPRTDAGAGIWDHAGRGSAGTSANAGGVCVREGFAIACGRSPAADIAIKMPGYELSTFFDAAAHAIDHSAKGHAFSPELFRRRARGSGFF